MDQVISTRIAKAYIIHPDIFVVEYEPNSIADLKDFFEGFGAYAKFARNRRLKVLADMGMECSIDLEAFKLATRNEMPAIAEAIVVRTSGTRMLMEEYVKNRSGDHPVSLFTDRYKAIKWLQNM